jgi:hypothetical protein
LKIVGALMPLLADRERQTLGMDLSSTGERPTFTPGAHDA